MSCEEDVSKQPCFQYLIGNTYELTKPVFFVKMSGEYALVSPGRNSETPVSIDDFLNHPNNWWESAAYRQRHGIHPEPVDRDPILGIVEAGTVIEIKRITCSTGGFFGYFLNPRAEICTGRFIKSVVQICGLMANLSGEETFPEPRPDCLRQLGITSDNPPTPPVSPRQGTVYNEHRSRGLDELLESVNRAKQKVAEANKAQRSLTSE